MVIEGGGLRSILFGVEWVNCPCLVQSAVTRKQIAPVFWAHSLEGYFPGTGPGDLRERPSVSVRLPRAVCENFKSGCKEGLLTLLNI